MARPFVQVSGCKCGLISLKGLEENCSDQIYDFDNHVIGCAISGFSDTAEFLSYSGLLPPVSQTENKVKN
jgi:hypothetical protein